MPVVAANRIEINYTDSGGEGPAVVFTHGFLMNQTMFDRQVTALAPEYRVITWDERGHGGTWATGPFVLGFGGRRARAARPAGRGARRAGRHVQGGFLSLRAALTAPDRVRALVLIDTQAGVEDAAVAPAYEQLHQVWLDNGPGPVQEVVASIILGPGQWDDWYAKWNEQYTEWAPDDLGQLSWPFRCLMDRDDITGRLAEITSPTLIVHGTADAAIPMERAEAVRDGLGGPVTLIPVEGAAHASNVTHPHEVNQAIRAFLSGLDGE